MAIRFYNYLSRKIENFKPLKSGCAGLYTCGPTAYNFAHIGNLRTYIFEDVLKRALMVDGFKVNHIMNITDVDDKTVRDAKIAGKTLEEFTSFYTKAFFTDLKKLNILPADKYPYATKHISEIIKLIKRLLIKKLAYIASDGIYFDISRFKNYGKLSKIKKVEIKTGTRVNLDEYSKEEVRDFVLWKFKKAKEPFWRSPWGDGRPGWHIECSAMSMKYLGSTFDIHSAGIDLLFPHHENEIAQSEGATGKKFVKYFIEGEHLLVEGKKMSKSLGNIFTLRDLENRGADPIAFRYFVLGAHYRSQLNFTWESLNAAANSLARLREFIFILRRQNKQIFSRLTLKSSDLPDRQAGASQKFAYFTTKFNKTISEDLNTPKALAVLWELISTYNKNPATHNPKYILNTIYKFDEVLGLGLKEIKEIKPPKKVIDLLNEREKARKNKNFKRADELRTEIARLGWQIEDKVEGPLLKKL